MTNVETGRKGFVRRPLDVRFWEKVSSGTEDECWPWTGAVARRGYGIIWANGRNRRASQIAWELANNQPFPVGKVACHRCDNPSCVNPAHIFVGSMTDNMRDAAAKKRLNQAHRKTHCKYGHPLTPETVYVNPKRGDRVCLVCKRRVMRESRRRKALALASSPDEGGD